MLDNQISEIFKDSTNPQLVHINKLGYKYHKGGGALPPFDDQFMGRVLFDWIK